MSVVIGLPSYNESATVAEVTYQLDLGARKFLPDMNVVLVNADNGSADGTQSIFELTETRCQKYTISTAPFIGKGRNVKAVIDFCAKTNSDLLLFDTDLRWVEPGWVESLFSPLRDRQADFVAPLYRLSRYEGDITKQVVVPILHAVFGRTVCQPIGGEFGLSARFVRFLAEQPLPAAAQGYGIDVYLTTTALAEGLAIEEVALGTKHHAPNLPKTLTMCAQVAESLLTMIRPIGCSASRPSGLSGTIGRYGNSLYFHGESPDETVLGQLAKQSATILTSDHCSASLLLPDEIAWRASFGVSLPWLPTERWATLLLQLLTLSARGGIDRLSRSFSAIYGARLLSFWAETTRLTEAEVDRILWRPAIELREKMRSHSNDRTQRLQPPAQGPGQVPWHQRRGNAPSRGA